MKVYENSGTSLVFEKKLHVKSYTEFFCCVFGVKQFVFAIFFCILSIERNEAHLILYKKWFSGFNSCYWKFSVSKRHLLVDMKFFAFLNNHKTIPIPIYNFYSFSFTCHEWVKTKNSKDQNLSPKESEMLGRMKKSTAKNMTRSVLQTGRLHANHSKRDWPTCTERGRSPPFLLDARTNCSTFVRGSHSS